MLKMRGHHVIHYGHEDSKVECDQHETVVKRYDLDKSYPDWNWRTQGFPNYRLDDHCYRYFYARTISKLHINKQQGDFLLLPFGMGHKPVADAHPDMIACESGIGYPTQPFAKYRVYESYAILHAAETLTWVQSMSNDKWYHAVIPNAFDLADFEFSAEKDDYFLFLGRVNPGKGTHIALQIVEEIGGRLVVAGAGHFSGDEPRTQRPASDYVEMKGVVGPEERKALLSRARCVIAASTFMEPFCGVQIESMLSGTPVISTDWGAFAEYNIHGVTGYRCRTFEQFCWAARNIARIQPTACRNWAEWNFSLERVADMYDEYFWSVNAIYGGRGWYEANPTRTDLAWLNKIAPPLMPH
jgi:glycosyltransferase involved in cell wall biosynthesis